MLNTISILLTEEIYCNRFDYSTVLNIYVYSIYFVIFRARVLENHTTWSGSRSGFTDENRMINDLQILDRWLVICSQSWYIDYVVCLGPEETLSIVIFGVWINKGLKTRLDHIT